MLRIRDHIIASRPVGVGGEAIALYTKHGFEPVERYNDNPEATHFFGKTL